MVVLFIGGRVPLPRCPNLLMFRLTARNITFRNVLATNVSEGQTAGCFMCSASSPCTNYLFDNVQVFTGSGAEAAPYTCGNVTDVLTQGTCAPAPCGL